MKCDLALYVSPLRFSVFALEFREFLCKPRAECTLSVVNRGPKGRVCTRTHKGHTLCSIFARKYANSHLHKALFTVLCSFDRIGSMGCDGAFHCIPGTCWRLLRRRLSRRVLLRVSARVQCSSLARGVVKGGGPAPARRRARQVTPRCERGEPSIPVSAGNGGALAGTGAERAVWAVHAALR